MDILNDKSCPICNAELNIVSSNWSSYCKNKCCEFIFHHDGTMMGIRFLFDEDTTWYSAISNGEKALERIEYWRENSRYLAEILERS